jgi:hypothetical protein
MTQLLIEKAKAELLNPVFETTKAYQKEFDIILESAFYYAEETNKVVLFAINAHKFYFAVYFDDAGEIVATSTQAFSKVYFKFLKNNLDTNKFLNLQHHIGHLAILDERRNAFNLYAEPKNYSQTELQIENLLTFWEQNIQNNENLGFLKTSKPMIIIQYVSYKSEMGEFILDNELLKKVNNYNISLHFDLYAE